MDVFFLVLGNALVLFGSVWTLAILFKYAIEVQLINPDWVRQVQGQWQRQFGTQLNPDRADSIAAELALPVTPRASTVVPQTMTLQPQSPAVPHTASPRLAEGTSAAGRAMDEREKAMFAFKELIDARASGAIDDVTYELLKANILRAGNVATEQAEALAFEAGIEHASPSKASVSRT